LPSWLTELILRGLIGISSELILRETLSELIELILRGDAGITLSEAKVKGRIVFVGPYFCSFEDKIIACQNAGCIGVILRQNYWKVGGFMMWSVFDGHHSRSQLHVPMTELGEPDAETLYELMQQTSRSLNSTIVITMSNGDHNPYQEMFEGVAWNGMRVVYIVIGLYGMYLALQRLVLGGRDIVKRKLAFFVLFLECFANLARVVYLAIDVCIMYVCMYVCICVCVCVCVCVLI